MDIRVLASSSKGNAYIVSDGETTLLIECGIPYRKLQEKCGYSMASISGCLLSHEHGDHSRAVRDVIKQGIDVYCSAGTAAACGISGYRVHELAPLTDILIGTMVVKPFDTQHDCAQPYGFLIRSARTREILMFATDTYYIKYRFPGMTHIMVEANYDVQLAAPDDPIIQRVMHSHMSKDALREFFTANDMSKVEQVYLLHLSDARSSESEFKTMVQELTGAEVYV